MTLKLTLQNKLTNYIMQNGNKQTSERILLKSYKLIQKVQKKKSFKEIFKLALVNNSPFFHLKQIQRKKKKVFEFPFLLKPSLKLHYGIKSLINNTNIKTSFSFYKRYSLEILNSSKLISEGIKKKKEIYKIAFLTKRYANYRWF